MIVLSTLYYVISVTTSKPSGLLVKLLLMGVVDVAVIGVI